MVRLPFLLLLYVVMGVIVCIQGRYSLVGIMTV